jgi:nucleotide-binding universal stress UspA family protein
MDKILLVIDGIDPSMPALDFACYLGRLTRSKITGVFLENLPAEQKPVLKTVHGSPILDWELDETSLEYIGKQKMIDANIIQFKEACTSRSVQSTVHRDAGVPANEIISESRYADIIVVDAATSFNKTFEGSPTEFVKDVLKDAECPVIIAPEGFEGLDEIIFAYDGSKSAAFAIKQFAYLLPELEDKRAILLQINEKGEWNEEDKHNIGEWLQNRYSAIGFQVLEGNTDDRLFDYLFKRKKSMVVMGAYGRTSVSRFFKKSHADRIIKTMTLPIFISHY